MDVMHIVGNRPQFIKLAPVSRELRKRNIQEAVIHTGQHYDSNMSAIFFEELGIPEPAANLGIGSGSHAQVTGRAMIEIEQVLIEYGPKCVAVYGDTNSTLAAALAAAKLSVPVLHVEAGPRTYNRKNPEECNRVVVDHIADYLCTPDRRSAENLLKEGIPAERIFFTGDVMFDEFLYCLSADSVGDSFDGLPVDYALMTWHRQENTCGRERMGRILDFIDRVNFPVILPLHPRTAKLLDVYGLRGRADGIAHLKILPPVGYREMIGLMSRCRFLLSDSGGASKEASFVGKRCMYLLDLNIWPELSEAGYIHIVDVDAGESVEQGLAEIRQMIEGGVQLGKTDIFGDGNAAGKIADIVETILL